MRKFALFLLLAGIALPALAARRVTVAQLDQTLAALHDKSDVEAADRLSELELTERLSSAEYVRLSNALPGEKSQQALRALADMSAFLDPPSAEIPATVAPDLAAQRRMLGLTVDYVGKTIPQLPNLFARRETTRFEDTPLQQNLKGFFVPHEPLHRVGVSSATVFYRGGREAVDSGAGKKQQPLTEGLEAVGVFGPILGTVLVDAARSKLIWSHWEQGTAGLEAVFSYQVPRENSHYEVNYCCVAEKSSTFSADVHPFRRIVGYRGEMAVDPVTGTIFRLVVEADLKADDPVVKAGILVEYGPMEIGGRTYYCPVKSISSALAEILPLDPRYKFALANQLQPLKTSLNEVAFEQYHVFRAETRVVAGGDGSPSPNPPAPGAGDGSSPSTAPKPSETASAEEAALSTPVAPGAGALPAPEAATTTAATSPEPATPEIGVAMGGMPDLPANPHPAPLEGEFTLQATARLVDVGVVAFDKKGRAVTDLKAEDFEIYDNGRKQEIRNFSQAASEDSAAASAQPLPQDRSADAQLQAQPAFSNRRAAAETGTGASAPVSNTTILLIDASNLAWGDLTYARAEMLRFLAALPAGERAGLYVMRAHGFQILVEETADRGLLTGKLKQWMPSAQDLSRAQDEERRNRQQMDFVHSVQDLSLVNGNSVDAPDSFNSANPSSILPPDVQLRENGGNPGRDALSILAEVARHLAALTGHKSLVWVSSDNVLADWSSNAASIDKGSKFIDGLALRAQEGMNEAHVSVYPLDASELEAGGIGADIGTRNVLAMGRSDRDAATMPMGDAAPGMKPGRVAAQMQQDTHPIQGVFRELADSTGGRTLRRSGGIASELEGVVNDGRAAYLLSFTPSLPADGKYHVLTVKVKSRRDITLRYRTGYEYDQDPATPKDRFRQAVWQPADVNEIGLSANPVAAATGSILRLNIAAADLALAQQGARWADKLDIFLVQRDDAGLHAQITGQTLVLRLTPATYQKVLRDGIPFDQSVETGPETSSVRVLVLDENSGRMGTVTAPAAAIGN